MMLVVFILSSRWFLMSGLSLSSFVEVMVRDEDASTLVYRLVAVSQCAKGFRWWGLSCCGGVSAG